MLWANHFSVELKVLVSMGTVVWRRRATETVNYSLNIGVNKGKLISCSSEFVISLCLTLEALHSHRD